VPRSLASLVAFFFGAIIGGRIATTLAPISRRKWTTAAFGTETILLLAATLSSMNYRAPSADSTLVYTLIVLTALAMGIRNATVGKIGLQDLTTTVLTRTITGLAADSSLAGGSNARWVRRFLSVVVMFTGAAAGAMLLKRSLALPLAVATLSAVC